MTAGIIIYNDSNTIQLDDTYNNLAVRATGITTVANQGWKGNPLSGLSSPILAFQPTGDYAGVFFGNSRAPDCTPNGVGNNGASVRWWMFDHVVNPSNYGLVVYNTAGEVTFDACKQQARVVDVISSDTPGSFPYGTYTYTAGRSYAVAFLRVARRSRVSDRVAGQYHYWTPVITLGTAKITGNSLSFSTIDLVGEESGGVQIGPGPETTTPGYTIAVLDVTNY